MPNWIGKKKRSTHGSKNRSNFKKTMKQIKQEDKSLTITPKIIAPVVARASEIEIIDAPSMKVAVEFLSEANNYLDKVVEWKEKKTKPLNEALKVIRAETKPVEKALEEAIENVRGKMSAYQTAQVRIQKEQADKIAQKVSDGKIKIETGVHKLGEIAVPEKEVATDAGLVQFRETKVLKIVDIKLVPDKYFVIDEAEVMSDLKQGIEVPGCEINIIQTPINYR